VPDRRKHRGPHPEDARLFDPVVWPRLRESVADLCWLLGRGYTGKAALKLVGDRYDLVARQRTAVARCACSDAEAARRKGHQVSPETLADRVLWVDGYNALTTIEAALADGVILPGRDGTYRDLASMHGSYRKVSETVPALELLGKVLRGLKVSKTVWYLDRPVSNSGRLRGIMQQVATDHDWPWQIELVQDPDTLLADTDEIIATADSVVLDRCKAWFNLARETVERKVPKARVIAMVPEKRS